MKKNLIALAVAASAVVSGASMAADGWEIAGGGHELMLGGTLILNQGSDENPWEVKVGPSVTNLDGSINKGESEVNITVASAVPVLGIRTHGTQAFHGKAGISPQINYGGAINLDSFSRGKTSLTLNVTDASSSNKIGTMTTTLFAGAVYSEHDSTGRSLLGMSADRAGSGFYGGLPNNVGGAVNYAEAVSKLNAIDSSLLARFDKQNGTELTGINGTAFNFDSSTYSGVYGSGILANAVLNIKLDNPAASQDIKWRASLPITVTYA